MVEEAERRQAEAERLRQEVMHAREAEKEAKNKLIGRFFISKTGRQRLCGRGRRSCMPGRQKKRPRTNS
jgi:hypothetical protein